MLSVVWKIRWKISRYLKNYICYVKNRLQKLEYLYQYFYIYWPISVSKFLWDFSVRSSVKVPEFDKHVKKAGRYIDRNVVEITIKMKTIVWKPLMIKIIRLRQLIDTMFVLPWKISRIQTWKSLRIFPP